MIIIDANILLYAYDSKAQLHIQASSWLSRTFSAEPLVGVPWQNIGAFLRITTNTRIPGERLSPAAALGIIGSWLERPNVVALGPSERHWEFLRDTMTDGRCRGSLVADAQLAALTIEYGGILHTTDRDFARFPGLRWTNPLG